MGEEKFGEVRRGAILTSRSKRKMAKVSVHLPSAAASIVPAVVGENEKFISVTQNGKLNAQPQVSYSIVHVVPGRVRVRVPRLSHDAEYARRLQLLLEKDS